MFTRRNFIKTGAAVTVSGQYFTGRVFAESKGDIGVATGNNIDAAVRAAVAAVGGIGAFVKKGDRVAVKPNLSFASPVERAATTNPEVLSAVIKLCLEAGAKNVIVLDHPLQDAAIIGTKAEIAQVVKEIKNASLFLPTTEDLYEEKPIPKGKLIKKTKVITMMKDLDVLINVPITKNHSATGVSLGLKGNMGLVWNRIEYHNASDLNQAIADLATIVRADLTIVDAIRALTTRGPQGPGKVLDFNTIIAGRDPVAVDAYAVAMAFQKWNLTGKQVPHIVKSSEMGVGALDPNTLNIIKQSV